MMDENNSEVFGDIPEFYSAIINAESNVITELNQFKDGGLISILETLDSAKQSNCGNSLTSLITEQIKSEQTYPIPIFVKAKSLAKIIKADENKRRMKNRMSLFRTQR